MSNRHYNGNITFTYNGEEYEATVCATGTYTFIKGRRYMPNGDPGYPDEEDFEIDDVDIEAVFKDGEEVPYTEDMYDDIEAVLCDSDEWEEDDYDDEPPDDYYEERAMARWERQLDRYDL